MQRSEPPKDSPVSDFGTMLDWFTGNGQEHRAYQAIKRGDYEEARHLLEPLAARNSVYSLITLGWLYETGSLGPPNLKTAMCYYERAADQGNAEAQFRLGRFLVEQGLEADARIAFEHAAAAGGISAMYWLGKLVLQGRGGTVEASRGIELLEKAAAHGHFFAKRELLGYQIRGSRSIVQRSVAWFRILVLAFKVGRASLKNPDSDLLR